MPEVSVSSPDWFVAHARPRCEKKVVRYCEDLGVTTTLPIYRSVKKYHGKTVTFEKTLFPGYVFLKGAADDAFSLDRAGRLAQIIDITDQRRVNFELRNIHFALSKDASLSHFPYLHRGVRVEIRSGPLRGLQGVVEDWARRDRLILQVDILGRAVSLEVDGSLLDVID